MKREAVSLIVLTMIILALALGACGKNNDEPATAAPVEAVLEASGELSEDIGDAAQTEADKRELAETMVGKTMEELIELIGEPTASDYAPSCLGPGEDGEHQYDGFIVYTYREGDMERVEEIFVIK